MGRIKFYKVIDEFDANKDYGVKLFPQQSECLTLLKEGQIVSQKDFLEKHLSEITRRSKSKDVSGRVVSTAFGAAEKMGILQKLKPHPTSFEEFCQKDTISYYIKQLRGSKLKNTTTKNIYGLSSTQMNYTYALWRLSNWFEGRDFEYHKLIQTSQDSFVREKTKIKLEGLEHFFKLYVESYQSEPDFAKMIKNYDVIVFFKAGSRKSYEQCIAKACEESGVRLISFGYGFMAGINDLPKKLEEAGKCV